MRRMLVGALLLLNTDDRVCPGICAASDRVRSDDGPVRDADVVINRLVQKAGADGTTVFTLPPGHVEIAVVKNGFAPA